MMKYPLRTQILSGLGTASILAIAIVITGELYLNGLENMVYANNYTTNFLIDNALEKTSIAAPWALLSLNYFICKSSVKKWRSFVFKRFL